MGQFDPVFRDRNVIFFLGQKRLLRGFGKVFLLVHDPTLCQDLCPRFQRNHLHGPPRAPGCLAPGNQWHRCQ